MGAQLIFGLKVGLIGMCVTFVGLTILVGLIHVNRIIAEAIDNMKKNKSEPVKETPTPVAKAPQAAVKAEAQEADNSNVIAAITAAVSVVMEGTPFKVKSVKRAGTCQNTNAWDMVAIQEQNNNL